MKNGCDRVWEHSGGHLTDAMVVLVPVMAVVAMTVVMMVRMTLVQSTGQAVSRACISVCSLLTLLSKSGAALSGGRKSGFKSGMICQDSFFQWLAHQLPDCLL